MEYISVAEAAKRWNVSPRSVRNYCAQGRVEGAFLTGKTWNIPENAAKPRRLNARETGASGAKSPLLVRLREEKAARIPGGIYHKLQIEFTYNSNHIEGSRLTHDQTRLIFETATLGGGESTIRVDDVIETANHFRCIDLVIDRAEEPLSEEFAKLLHRTLKTATSDSARDWFAVGDYKQLPNEVGGRKTARPEDVGAAMRELISGYELRQRHSFEDIVAFHVAFERIHPFQDGNGRVGRLISLKECLRNGVVPFAIDEDKKMFYYRGLAEWDREPGYLLETCRAAQDACKDWLDYFRIDFEE